MVFDRPIIMQKLNEDTESWEDYLFLHCRLNKSSSKEYLNVGAIQSTSSLIFEVRYCPLLKDVYLNTQFYRIVYDGNNYNITDYDDFQFKHKTVKFLGVSY